MIGLEGAGDKGLSPVPLESHIFSQKKQFSKLTHTLSVQLHRYAFGKAPSRHFVFSLSRTLLTEQWLLISPITFANNFIKGQSDNSNLFSRALNIIKRFQRVLPSFQTSTAAWILFFGQNSQTGQWEMIFLSKRLNN